jgi:hypothetical protein
MIKKYLLPILSLLPGVASAQLVQISDQGDTLWPYTLTDGQQVFQDVTMGYDMNYATGAISNLWTSLDSACNNVVGTFAYTTYVGNGNWYNLSGTETVPGCAWSISFDGSVQITPADVFDQPVVTVDGIAYGSIVDPPVAISEPGAWALVILELLAMGGALAFSGRDS